MANIFDLRLKILNSLTEFDKSLIRLNFLVYHCLFISFLSAKVIGDNTLTSIQKTSFDKIL
ncbi:MAG: hypothetical protein LBH45_01545 [Campylobacteraceae bacterium]|jgi:hypothetical protein|nr:hypothetical protein [Campylobacteraceae bacterium]